MTLLKNKYLSHHNKNDVADWCSVTPITRPRRSASRLHRNNISSQQRGWYVVTKRT